MQSEQTEPLPSHRQPDIRQAKRMHVACRFTFERLDDRDLFDDLVGVFVQIPIFEQVGHQRMQAIDADKLFGEVEGGAKVIYSAIQVRRVSDVEAMHFTSKSEYSRS